MLIINPSSDQIDIYNGSLPRVTISNNGNMDIASICNTIITLYGISKTKEIGIVLSDVNGMIYSNYFKSKGYSVKDMKIHSKK